MNAAIKAAALPFENLPKDLSNMAMQFGNGLKLTDVRVLCCPRVVATLAQPAHHRSAVVRSELRAMLGDLHTQYGVWGQLVIPSTALRLHARDTWVDQVLQAMGTLGVGLLMPLSVYSCVHAQSAASAMDYREVGDAVLHLQG